jgi:phosphate transport system substrate-binding protein
MEDRRIMTKKGSPIMLLLLAAVTWFTAVGWAQSPVSDKETLVVRGSDSMAQMVDSYAKEFMQKHADAHIVVSGGSDNGWTSFIRGESTMCMASSEIPAEEIKAAAEKGKDVRGATVGWGGVVIIVHPSNPVHELTVEQVRKIFAGEYKNWKELGGSDAAITVLTVGEKREGTLAYVRDTLVKAPITPNAVVKTYFRSIVGGVAEGPSATGFVRVRNIVQLQEQGQQKKVKVIAIKENEQGAAVLPTRETVNNGTYPASRPYLLYWDAKSPSKLGKEFFEFAASKNPRKKVTEAR